MMYPIGSRRWWLAVRHVAAVLVCCPIAMAAEEKPTEPAGSSVMEGLYRVHDVIPLFRMRLELE